MGFLHSKKLIGRTLLIAMLAGSGLAFTGGCTGSAQYRGSMVVRSEPPPPREEYAGVRPGYVWIDGRWGWDDYASEWVWYDGYWEPERTGYVYVRGGWRTEGTNYVYVQPRWQNRTDRRVSVSVTDHSRPTKVRIRSNSGGRVPPKPIVRQR